MRNCFVIFALICALWIGDSVAETPNPSQTHRLIVMLEGLPVSRVALQAKGPSLYKGFRHKRSAAKALVDHRAALEREQTGFINRLQSLSPNIRIARRFTGLINAVAVEVPRSLEAQIESWPEVLAVVPTRRYRPLLNESNPLMGVPAAWREVGGDNSAGRGIKIGVIDTGIDVTHVMFDDTGYELPDGFPLGDTAFTNKKIIVARSFPRGSEGELESSPRDLDGHGTHAAACAAGRLDTPSPLGPISGVAPNAYLGNYKIFTAEFAYSDQIIAALEASVEDGMDIINMSLGDEMYIETSFDPEALAIRNAIASGVIVVAAAGNSGMDESIGSPGQIPEVITVGSVSNGHDGSNPSSRNEATLNVYADGAQIVSGIQAILGDDAKLFSRPVTGRFPIVDADILDGGDYGGDSDGSVCEDLPPHSADGSWVLAQRWECTFSSKVDRIQAAGGWGALIYNSSTPPEGDPNHPVEFPSVPDTEIPTFFIGRGVGLQIKQAIQNHQTVEVEFVGPAPNEQTDEPFFLSSFSSLGPTVDYTIKPDLVAVGGGSFAAVQNDVPYGGPSGNRFQVSGFSFISGTSFSSPRVAGAAALVKQAHPGWTPGQIKSALITTADRPDPLDILSPMMRGGGFVSVDEAVDVPVLISPPTLTFRRQMVAGRKTVQRTFTLKNVSNKSAAISLKINIQDGGTVASASVAPGELAVAPDEEKMATLTIELTPPDLSKDKVDDDGDVVIAVEGLEEPLRIPFWTRTILAPQPVGSVLLLDDDDGQKSEPWYQEAVRQAGYTFTNWDMMEMQQYPDYQYMLHFQTVLWFMATTSLNSLPASEADRMRNDRIRFNTELTKYLARGGALFLSGQDWSDQQENAPFGQYVLHIRSFDHDPFYETHPETLTLSGVSDNPIAQGVGPQTLVFDGGFENFTDGLEVDGNTMVKPAFRSKDDPQEVTGVTVESCSYRAVFLAFALERLEIEGMSKIIANSLAWLADNQPEPLAILSIQPSSQSDTTQPITVQIDASGVNFPVGNQVSLDTMNAPITSIDPCGQLEIVAPAGLPDGLYDLTLRTADGQVVTLPNIFKVGMGDAPTAIFNWQIH